MTTQPDIAVFLEARLAEDETAAKTAASDPVGAMEAHLKHEALKVRQETKGDYDRGQADALMWAAVALRERMKPLTLHDPARAFREIEANWAILTAYLRVPTDSGLAAAVHALAAVYAGHPDYKPGWKQ